MPKSGSGLKARLGGGGLEDNTPFQLEWSLVELSCDNRQKVLERRTQKFGVADAQLDYLFLFGQQLHVSLQAKRNVWRKKKEYFTIKMSAYQM